jgi:hypothetical protein
MNHPIYNISSEYQNNVFTYTESSNITFLISDGFYTPQQLAQHLQNGLNATSTNSYNYSVLYSDINYKFSINCSSSFSLPVSALGQVLGFTLATGTGTTQLSDSITLLNDPQYMLLDISFVGATMTTTASQKTSFILTNNRESEEYNGLPNQCQVFGQPIQIQQFTVFLKNRDGTRVNMNGCNFAVLLELN